MISEFRSEELNELFSALSKAQSEIKVAGKDSANPFFKSSYANLQSIIEASRPSLCKNGLAVIQQLIHENNCDFLTTMLCHSSGQWILSKAKVSPAKTDVQSLGSYITYLRRYSYAALVGVYDGHEDDDGNSATCATQQQVSIIQSYDIALKNKILEYYNVKDIKHLKEIDAEKIISSQSNKK